MQHQQMQVLWAGYPYIQVGSLFKRLGAEKDKGNNGAGGREAGLASCIWMSC